jgi:hypothetical protein
MMCQLHKGFIAIATLVLVIFIASCGGGGGGGGGSLADGGIGGTGVTSGTVSGFGSVFVNGIEFETDGASRDVDDEIDISNGSDDDKVLGIGMVVTIIGTVNDDGVSGTAESIEYDDEVEGPVAAAPVEDQDMVSKTFEIFNFTVMVGRNTTVFSGTDYDSLAQNDLLEVSGYFDVDGKLLATRVEKEGVFPGDSEVEIRGEVSGFNGVDEFDLGGIKITFGGTTEFEDLPGTVKNGQFVEVEGTLKPATSIAASRIEREDEDFGDDVDQISIEGIVTDFNGTGNFKVAGQRVDASKATFEPSSLEASITDGDKVEVEGAIVDGILKAKEVEQRGGNARVSAIVDSKNSSAGTITLQVVQGQPFITVTTDSQTQIEDKRDEVEPFGISGIKSGDFLNVEGFVDGSGDFIATQIERDETGDIELRGPVDVPPTGGSTAAGTVSILGVEIATDGATDFEDASEAFMSGTDFFLAVDDDDLVEFTDNNEQGQPADGIADEVEFED